MECSKLKTSSALVRQKTSRPLRIHTSRAIAKFLPKWDTKVTHSEGKNSYKREQETREKRLSLNQPCPKRTQKTRYIRIKTFPRPSFPQWYLRTKVGKVRCTNTNKCFEIKDYASCNVTKVTSPYTRNEAFGYSVWKHWCSGSRFILQGLAQVKRLHKEKISSLPASLSSNTTSTWVISGSLIVPYLIERLKKICTYQTSQCLQQTMKHLRSAQIIKSGCRDFSSHS